MVIQLQRAAHPTPINILREAKRLHCIFKIKAWGLLFYTRKAASMAMTMSEHMTMTMTMTINTIRSRSRLQLKGWRLKW